MNALKKLEEKLQQKLDGLIAAEAKDKEIQESEDGKKELF